MRLLKFDIRFKNRINLILQSRYKPLLALFTSALTAGIPFALNAFLTGCTLQHIGRCQKNY